MNGKRSESHFLYYSDCFKRLYVEMTTHIAYCFA